MIQKSELFKLLFLFVNLTIIFNIPAFAADNTAPVQNQSSSEAATIIRTINNVQRFSYIFIGTVNKCHEATIKICDKCKPAKGLAGSILPACKWKMEKFYGKDAPKEIFIKGEKLNCDIFIKEKPYIYQNYLIFGRNITVDGEQIIYSESEMITPADMKNDEIRDLRYKYSYTEEEFSNGKTAPDIDHLPICYESNR